MRTVRIGQILALVGLALVLVAAAAAQSPTQVAGAPTDYAAIAKEIGFPAAAFLLLYWLFRTTLADHTRALVELTVAIRELRVHCGEREAKR